MTAFVISGLPSDMQDFFILLAKHMSGKKELNLFPTSKSINLLRVLDEKLKQLYIQYPKNSRKPKLQAGIQLQLTPVICRASS